MDNIFSLIKKKQTLFKRKDDYFPSKILTVLAEEVSCDTEKYHLLWLLLPKQPLPSAADLTQTSASPSWRKRREGLLLQGKKPVFINDWRLGHTALQEPGCVGGSLSKLLQPLF